MGRALRGGALGPALLAGGIAGTNRGAASTDAARCDQGRSTLSGRAVITSIRPFRLTIATLPSSRTSSSETTRAAQPAGGGARVTTTIARAQSSASDDGLRLSAT